MKKDDSVYLRHILDAIERIELYTTGVSFDEFVDTPIVQDGVVRQLEIVGEASRNLSPEFKAEHAQVSWAGIVGMRNRIVHAYFDLDLNAVWDAVKEDLPNLKSYVEDFLSD